MLQALTSRRVGGLRLRRTPVSAPARTAPVVVDPEAAHKKGVGSSKNGRDSASQRRGCKIYGDQPAEAGNIIWRQTGTTWHAGAGTKLARDYSVYAMRDGMVKYVKTKRLKEIRVVDFPVVEKQADNRRAKKSLKFPPRGKKNGELSDALATASAAAVETAKAIEE